MTLKHTIVIATALVLTATVTRAQNEVKPAVKSEEVIIQPGQTLIVDPAGQATTTVAHPETTAVTTTESSSWHHRFAYEQGAEKFRNQEFSMDLFGSYLDVDGGKSSWGGGVGLNYFFGRYIGIGGDAFMQDDGRQFVNSTTGSLILRFPFASVAPYAFGGGGWNFDPKGVAVVHGGGGIEFRLNPHTGIFGDARYVFTDKTRDYILARAGVRFSF